MELKEKKVKELNSLELKEINGGSLDSYTFGFLAAAYVDFEIGLAIGIAKGVKKSMGCFIVKNHNLCIIINLMQRLFFQ